MPVITISWYVSHVCLFPCSRHPLSDLTMGNIFQPEEDSNQKQAPGPDGIPQKGLKDCELNETL